MIFRVGKTELTLRKQRSAYETYAREDVFTSSRVAPQDIFPVPA